jgi:hypothetical protein
MGPGKHENVGKSQSVFVWINPITPPRTRIVWPADTRYQLALLPIDGTSAPLPSADMARVPYVSTAPLLGARASAHVPDPPPIGAPCTHCLRHGDPMQCSRASAHVPPLRATAEQLRQPAAAAPCGWVHATVSQMGVEKGRGGAKRLSRRGGVAAGGSGLVHPSQSAEAQAQARDAALLRQLDEHAAAREAAWRDTLGAAVGEQAQALATLFAGQVRRRPWRPLWRAAAF